MYKQNGVYIAAPNLKENTTALALPEFLFEAGQLQLLEDLRHVIRTGVHQCNNHLAGIVIICELLQIQDNPENIEKKIDKLRSRSSSIENVLRSIYFFSQINVNLESTTVSAKQFLHEILQNFEMDLKNINLKTSFQAQIKDIQITTKIDYFKKTIKNLIQNSIEAVNETENPHVEIKLDVNQEGFVLEVKDSGPRIEAEIIERFFTPFFSTKPGQLGQGLTEAQCFIKTVGGQIYFERIFNQNSFKIVIPHNEFFYAKQV